MTKSELLMKAFASGIVEALLATEGQAAPADLSGAASTVIPLDSIRQAVTEYLDRVQQDYGQAQQPSQMDLFPEPDIEEDLPPNDISEMILSRVEQARARVAAEEAGKDPENWQNPDEPGASHSWSGPLPS